MDDHTTLPTERPAEATASVPAVVPDRAALPATLMPSAGPSLEELTAGGLTPSQAVFLLSAKFESLADRMDQLADIRIDAETGPDGKMSLSFRACRRFR